MTMIHLIGFSGVGKSTCAPVLSELIGKKFIDLDEYVSKETGMRQFQIFSEHGQDYYREIESIILKSVINNFGNHILVTGGGTVILKENRRLLKRTGKVIYLTASPKTIIQRLMQSMNSHDAAKPLLSAIEMEKFLENILKFREVYYMDAADATIHTDGLSPREVALSIKSRLGL
jgi:shikimate kinase